MSSHHDYIIEITAQHDALKPFAPENGQPLRFKIGDAVITPTSLVCSSGAASPGSTSPPSLRGCMRVVGATT